MGEVAATCGVNCLSRPRDHVVPYECAYKYKVDWEAGTAIQLAPRAAPVESEATAMVAIRAAICRRPNVKMLRNNNGKISYQRIADVIARALGLGPGSVARIVKALLAGLGRPWSWGLGDGSPDYVGIVRGPVCSVTFGIEVKGPTGKLSEDQKAWGAMAEQWGIVWGMARTVEEAEAIVMRAEARAGW